MARSRNRLIGSDAVRRFGSSVRTTELPDKRLIVIYPVIAVTVVAVIVFGLVHRSHPPRPVHGAIASAPTATADRAPRPGASRPAPSTSGPSSTMSVLTEKGTHVVLPRPAVAAIDGSVGVIVGDPSSSTLIVSETPSGRSVTAAVTFLKGGQSEQRLVTVAFHLAIPARDLDEAFGFYVEGLGCKLARRYDDRITLDFFRDQVVCHLSDHYEHGEPDLYPRHFGVTFAERRAFDALMRLVELRKLPVARPMAHRFEGLVEEHLTLVLRDPSKICWSSSIISILG